MQYFLKILNLLESTDRISQIIGKKTVLKFSWKDKERREIFQKWLKELQIFAITNPMQEGFREPLLFTLTDKIMLENKGKILLFLKDMGKNLTHPLLESLVKNKQEEWEQRIYVIIQELSTWQKVSEEYYMYGKKDLEELTKRPDIKTFYCMIKEFHPTKLIGKHPVNEVQLNSLETLSTEQIIETIQEDPISGHRFFLPGDDIPATGINILTGNHRIYILFKRYINGLLQNTCIKEHCNGEIFILLMEKY